MNPLRWILTAMFLCIGTAAQGTVFEIGPDKPYATPNDCPWESLNPGDTVLIYWRTNSYLSKWNMHRPGTANAPITVRGVPGPNGELPVIDGNGATQRTALDYYNQDRCVFKIGAANNSALTPNYIVIENLEVRGARPPYTYTTKAGTTGGYNNTSSGIYVEIGDSITIRNCIFRDNANGLFTANRSSNVLVERNYLFDNGLENLNGQHNSYTESVGITFQFNRYGPLRPTCGGNALKDRSSGTIIRYNWIEGASRQIDLIESTYPQITNAANYHKAWVYGNYLVKLADSPNRGVIHFGWDTDQVTKLGPLYLYNNTIISLKTSTTLLNLDATNAWCDSRNNIIYNTSPGAPLYIIEDMGRINLTHNWLNTGWVNASPSGANYSVTNDSNLTGSAPGLVSAAAQNYQLTNTSLCIDAGTNLHPSVLPTYDLLVQYVKHQGDKSRALVESLDLGASEFTTNALAMLWLQASGHGTNTVLLKGGNRYDYVLQFSTNLIQWVNFSTNTTGTNGLTTIVDNEATGLMRFYRAMQR
jgi:hypothetical protein